MAKTKKLVALLPMKAHSERVPNKNFRHLGNKPLFRWMLDTLLSIDEIDQIVINTDAENELNASGFEQDERILLRTRRPELCGDLVSMNRILGDDIAAVPADLYLMTHTTNPFLSAESIGKALTEFKQAKRERDIDSLFSVTRFQTRFYRSDGTPINHDPANLIRTQDLEPWFEENSNLYLFTSQSFNRTGARIGERPLLFESPKRESIDIDDWDDWRIAESIAAGAAFD